MCKNCTIDCKECDDLSSDGCLELCDDCELFFNECECGRGQKFNGEDYCKKCLDEAPEPAHVNLERF